MRLTCLVGMLLCGFLVGCDQVSLMKKFTPPEDELSARNYVDLLRQRKFDQITRDLDPSLSAPNITDTFAKMAAMIPAETPQSVKVVGGNIVRAREYSTTSITLEYQFPTKWLLVDVSTRKVSGSSTITGFHVIPLSDSLENLNRFTLSGKGAIQYLVLTLGIGSFGFSLYVLVLCIRSKGVKRKWLWIPFTLVGAEKLAVNWATGQLTYGLLAIQIPCLTASHPPYGPWTIGVFLPIGAIAFLTRQRGTAISGDSFPPPEQGPQLKEAKS